MTRWYLDTSAALKLIVEEPESQALSDSITSTQPQLVGCYLLETEVRRAVQRYPELTQSDAVALIDGIDLYEVPPSLFRDAGLLPGESLRSLDALHLAAALRLDVNSLITYDTRMADAAETVGLSVLSPGR